METPSLLPDDWPVLLTLLPADLETTARETGALQRRRGVPSAQALLRLAFAYAVTGRSLRATALWAATAGVAQLSDVALCQRLRRAAPWCGRLLAQQLAKQTVLRKDQWPAAVPIRLVDATTVSRPGSTGTDFRVHLQFDLGTLTVTDVTLTDAQGGESLKQCRLQPGEIGVGDRGYAHRQGIAAVAAAQAWVIVRLNWQNVPLQHPEGTPFDLLGQLDRLAPGEIGEWTLQTAPAKDGTPAIPGRLIAVRKSAPAAEASRRKLLAAARKKGKTPAARTLAAAAFVFVFTTVPAAQLAAPEVLEVYRFRWQIELAFKRLKGLLALDEMAAKDPALCRTFLCIKLLGALLVDQLSHRWVDFSPWGYGCPPPPVAGPPSPGGGGDGEPGGRRRAGHGGLGNGRRAVAGPVAGLAAAPAEPGSSGRLLCPSAIYP